jgi:hypothetical protein
MNYDKINKVDIDGNGNIVLQDVGGGEITVNYNDTATFGLLLSQANEMLLEEIQKLVGTHGNNQVFESLLEKHLSLPPEIKQQKDSITQKLAELKQRVGIMKGGASSKVDTGEVSEDTFDDIDFEDLLEAIKNKNCVLFLGPEISFDSAGKSLHEAYYISISNNKVTYNTGDGFFMPGSEAKLINKTKTYYSEVFPEQNQAGNDILEKLAQIPFNLIVSFCPDNSMARIFSKYNIEAESIDYSGTELDIDLSHSSEKTVIFNALGCAANNGRYIFTHKQFDDYVKKEKAKTIPLAIEAIINQATNYIFIGFGFNKWYYRLLMFEFELLEGSERYVCEKKDRISPLNRVFLEKQFGVKFIDTEYNDFVNVLLKNSLSKGLSKPLDTTFAESIINELETIRVKTFDSSKLEELIGLQNEVKNIENKIIENIK